MTVLSFNDVPYFKLKKAEDIQYIWFIIIIKIKVMKLLKVKLNAKIGWKITQTNYFLYRILFNKILNYLM